MPPITVSRQRADIFTEIENEREYQDTQWGHAQDDKWTNAEWIHFLENYANARERAVKYEHDFRTRMVKVAAIAVAYLESHDRKNFTKPADEYLLDRLARTGHTPEKARPMREIND
jgi:hypothetical protein